MRREDDNEYGMGRDIEGGGNSAWRAPHICRALQGKPQEACHLTVTKRMSHYLALTVLTSVNVNRPAAVPWNCLLGLVTKSCSHFVVRTSTVKRVSIYPARARARVCVYAYCNEFAGFYFTMEVYYTQNSIHNR
jgi:hypothetical protein